MGFRFQKRVKILPGVTLNFSKSGVSTSVGTKGARVTLGHGKTRTTVGIPGTGMSHTSVKSSRTATASRRTTVPPAPKQQPHPSGGTFMDRVLAVLYGFLALSFGLGVMAGVVNSGPVPWPSVLISAAIAAWFAHLARKRWKRPVQVIPLTQGQTSSVGSPSMVAEFATKVFGVSHTNSDGSRRQTHIQMLCHPGIALDLRREPGNTYDPDAIAVFCGDAQIGYLSAEIAEKYAADVDAGAISLSATVTDVTGGVQGRESRGVNITLTVEARP